MKVEIIRDNDNKVVGYKIVRESIDELETIERIRDMHFWGHLGKIKYDGRLSDKVTDDTLEISFVSEEYQKKKKEEDDARWERRRQIFDFILEKVPHANKRVMYELSDEELDKLADSYHYFSTQKAI